MVRSEATRKLIIEKTAKLFNVQGYVGTSMSDLEKATGLTKGSIYGNFKNKNEVAVEAFRHNYKITIATIVKETEKVKRMDEKLLTFVSYYEQNYKKVFANGGCPILNTATESDDGNELLKAESQKALKNWIKSIDKIVSIGIKRKEIKATDSKQFANRFVALMEGSLMMAKLLNDPQILLSNFKQLKKEIAQLSTA